MFWDSYAVVGGFPARISSTLLDEGLWNECRFTFRSRRTGDAVTGAFCEGPPFIRDGRVSMRALYFSEHKPRAHVGLDAQHLALAKPTAVACVANATLQRTASRSYATRSRRYTPPRYRSLAMRRVCLALILAMLLQQDVGAANPPIGISTIEVRLFLAHTGEFSAPIDADAILWNSPTEGTDRTPSTSTLVKVLVTGPSRASIEKATITLEVTNFETKRKVSFQRKVLDAFSAPGQQYVAFWLLETGCEPLQLTVRAPKPSRPLTRRIRFVCGE